jgi:ribonuclease J
MANGKSIFYSGDFRNHGRKANAFKWFTHNAPQNVDYLLLEGTTIGRESKPFKTETEIEHELTEAVLPKKQRRRTLSLGCLLQGK